MASEEVIPGLVSVLVLTYNTGSSLELCLESVLAQPYPQLELIITDNASLAETRSRIERFLETAKTSIPVKMDWSRQNLGYAGGRNRGIRQSRGEYVLCLNHDVMLDGNFIERAVQTMRRDSRIGAVQGKLIQSSKQQAVSSRYRIIDTTGLVPYKSRYFANRGHGEEDKGQYEKEEEVFGVDGAAPLYRRSALEDIKLPSTPHAPHTTDYEYFDTDFFLYKEDIDISWRLRLASWKIVYQPRARATNTRTSKTGLNFLEARFQTPRRVRYFSFRNYHFLLLKNEGGWFFVAHLPWIVARECGYLLMSLLFEFGNLAAVGDIIWLLPRMLRKRRIIVAHRRVEWKEVYRWFK